MHWLGLLFIISHLCQHWHYPVIWSVISNILTSWKLNKTVQGLVKNQKGICRSCLGYILFNSVWVSLVCWIWQHWISETYAPIVLFLHTSINPEADLGLYVTPCLRTFCCLFRLQMITLSLSHTELDWAASKHPKNSRSGLFSQFSTWILSHLTAPDHDIAKRRLDREQDIDILVRLVARQKSFRLSEKPRMNIEMVPRQQRAKDMFRNVHRADFVFWSV